jgi:DNA repair protein RadC
LLRPRCARIKANTTWCTPHDAQTANRRSPEHSAHPEIGVFNSLSEASVHPREVVKATIQHSAAALILFHNHPSLCAMPSQADELITQRLKDVLALIDMRLLDHLIVGERFFSFAEAGRL